MAHNSFEGESDIVAAENERLTADARFYEIVGGIGAIGLIGPENVGDRRMSGVQVSTEVSRLIHEMEALDNRWFPDNSGDNPRLMADGPAPYRPYNNNGTRGSGELITA